ncbi:dihydrodipicolinate reductase [Algoriphagus ratkowskyi]|uniref:4-hydroxy-tetrahydrodipicolinate reductase n=1 Tax=Algoriphagus ratkowskyi TaxID=57028 RepID=A0A2W7S0P9_9BACT|nr:4-hydroxy-tetrahydrodipicolinate reductase [Algoriphagus ratkowskyi]PZX60419.1 dihydrodipicolinate reductase [Algoriphagus ratkowskyi]TXD78230.1 4-hydroxy-tetrahydrodipicolinate reductase [Algoriphagus ratkowskyi]
MNILLLGYGKMGQLIGQLSESRGHSIAGKINIENRKDLDVLDPATIDVAIEFSQPEAAVENIKWAIERGIPILSGTTGWLNQKPEIEQLTLMNNGAFFYASNYSIGVNIFFKVNEFLAKQMNETTGYKSSVEEIHHTAKKDAPSGTAITLAEGIIKNITGLSNWNLSEEANEIEHSLPITSKRIDPAPGTHIIRYSSEIDDIEITHTAHSRQGFALGAILVAEWIQGKKGVLSMDDFLSF